MSVEGLLRNPNHVLRSHDPYETFYHLHVSSSFPDP